MHARVTFAQVKPEDTSARLFEEGIIQVKLPFEGTIGDSASPSEEF